MAIRLAVNYNNITHRFISTAQVTLTLTGPPETEAQGSKAGARRWDITAPVGQTFELRILIPAPTNANQGNPLLDLRQMLQVIALAKGGNSLTPKRTGSCPDTFDPRMTGQLVGAGAGRRFEVNVDLSFLDLTDYFGWLKGLTGYNALTPLVPLLQSGAAQGFAPPAPPAHYGCTLRILEYTGGAPVSWAVEIPPSVTATSNRVGAILFFRPTLPGTPYTNTDDLSITEFLRYLGDPPVATPWYPRPKPVNWEWYPSCGWEKQIAAPKKCAIFVHPFPQGSSFGTTISTKFPTMLASLLKTLWGDGKIGGSVCSDLQLARTAVSGFSAGGTATWGCLKGNPSKIDELYLFDPVYMSQNSNAVTSWFQLGGKKLRMYAGGYDLSTMLGIASQLNSSDASVWPTSHTDWGGFGLGALYAVAVTLNGNPQFGGISDASPGFLSVLTNMFANGADGNGGFKMQGKLPNGTVVNGVVPDCIAQEAAVAAIYMVNGQQNGEQLKSKIVTPITTSADFNNNLTSISNVTQSIRHQWPVVGGTDMSGDTNRGVNFTGFLQTAISQSGFP